MKQLVSISPFESLMNDSQADDESKAADYLDDHYDECAAKYAKEWAVVQRQSVKDFNHDYLMDGGVLDTPEYDEALDEALYNEQEEFLREMLVKEMRKMRE